LRSSVASPTVAGFIPSGGMAAPTWRNEAESSSLGLRLAGSPHRASPWGLLLSAPAWLHVGHLFDMLFTFQNNREARLGLTHRMTRIFQWVKRIRVATFWVGKAVSTICWRMTVTLATPRHARFFRLRCVWPGGGVVRSVSGASRRGRWRGVVPWRRGGPFRRWRRKVSHAAVTICHRGEDAPATGWLWPVMGCSRA
jgi:hypothetical protein